MTRGFHGWRVVAAVFLLLFAGFGSAYTFGAFVVPLQREFSVGRDTVSFVFGLAGFLYFALGAITGPLADRIGTRPLVAAGMALIGGGLIAASLATSALAALAGYALGIGLGLGCVYVPALAVVQHWFVRRRGFASGLAVSGIGVGTLVLPPLAQAVIDAEGWRGAYLALGILALASGAVATLLVRDDPAALDQFADGDRQPVASATVVEGATLGEAIRTPAFRFLYLAMLLIGVGAFVPFVHLVPYAMSEGVTAGRAAWLIGLIGIGSTAGRFVLGGWADRTGRGPAFRLMCLGIALSLAGWTIVPGFGGLIVFALVFGLFYGGWVALVPALASDLFGGAHIGAIIGALYTSVALGTLVGPGAVGLVYQAGGGYVPGILGAALLALGGTALLRLDGRTK